MDRVNITPRPHYAGARQPYAGPTQWFVTELHYGPPAHGDPFTNILKGVVRASSLEKAERKARRRAIKYRVVERGFRVYVYPVERKEHDRGKQASEWKWKMRGVI